MEGQQGTVEVIDRAVVDAVLADWGGGRRSGAIVRLGGLTNRMYRADTEVGPVAVRLPGRGTDAYIDREAELHNARVAARLGLGPVIHHGRGGAMVSAFIEGRVLTPADLRDDPHTRAQVARALCVVHGSPEPFLASFDAFVVLAGHRSALTSPPDDIDALIERIGRLDPPDQLVPCHNDPWPENFLAAGHRLQLLDWEYSAMGDPAWDLADVIVESRLDPAATEQFLTAYADGPIDAAVRERVAAMGPVTDLLWGLWALVQEQDGNDAMDFAAYGHRRLRRAGRSLST